MTSPISINGDRENVRVEDATIVISGGTTGIGRATAILLASEGARLLIFGRGKSELNDALRDICSVGSAVGMTADSSKREDVIKVFNMADRDLGGLDILIDNAALAADNVSDMRIEDQEYIVKTNLLGYMAMVHEAVKRMKPKGKGHIVVVGSMSANLREAGSSVYVVTKSGVQGFTEALRKEVREFGIKVSLIEPGEVGTNMNELSPAQQRQKQSQLKQLKAEDIADCIYYVLTRPKRVDIAEINVLPHLEDI